MGTVQQRPPQLEQEEAGPATFRAANSEKRDSGRLSPWVCCPAVNESCRYRIRWRERPWGQRSSGLAGFPTGEEHGEQPLAVRPCFPGHRLCFAHHISDPFMLMESIMGDRNRLAPDLFLMVLVVSRQEAKFAPWEGAGTSEFGPIC